MAPRPNWKGFLKLSLVSCPIALYTAASDSEKISLHLINRETGHRLRRQLVDAETGAVVEDKDQARGYEVSRGEHVILDDDELDDVALESTHTIDIETFVPRSEVDALYLDTPYFMIPDGEVGEQAFSVIRDAMKHEKMAGLARVVLYRRERIVMLEPRGAGMVATTLRYAYEVSKADDYFDEIPETEAPKEMLDLAEHIIATKAGTFDATKFEDRYEDALTALSRNRPASRPRARSRRPAT